MSTIAIKAENISKAYQLGEFSTGTLSRDIQRRFALMMGKEDPYLRIGETNDRTSKGGSNIVWSLKDMNFEINQGDAVGIIGRNGAGKSTLLKVLSRVTSPTAGNIKVKGRIASLLEVGTGFHPELTGRENIYLNGAILGMRKQEIKRKFDKIVDFAGVEKYIDTPVKRYSSGMYVRLAFAVAAHLESEILIVDEVLAVGDLDFQKKCLGKMNDVSNKEGRTVLFVSHNMDAVANLCKRAILLNNGTIKADGTISDVISQYTSLNKNNFKRGSKVIITDKFRMNNLLTRDVYFKEVYFENDEWEFASDQPISLKIKVGAQKDIDNFRVAGSIYDVRDKPIGTFFGPEELSIKDGEERIITCTIPSHNLAKGDYYFSLSVGKGNPTTGLKDYDVVIEVISFEINKIGSQYFVDWAEGWGNVYFPSITSIF
jgi:lipopolysaccharide transport system ATP-binding protein